MLQFIKNWLKEINFTWRDIAAILIISAFLMWLTNHVTGHICLCE